MKNKKLFLPIVILVVAVLSTIVYSVVNGIALKPTVTEGEFPFSITYELNGETVTINDVYSARYYRNGGYTNTKSRIYVGEIGNMGEGNTIYTLKHDANSSCRIELWTQFYADYLMGDPEYDYFDDEAFEPRIYYYDSEEQEYSDEETLLAQGVKLVSFEYPTPIENSFVFSHISVPDIEVTFPSLLIAFLAMIATLIFVKKDTAYVRKPIDIVTIIFNFMISFVVLPFFTVIALLLSALGDVGDIMNLIFYLLPALTVLSVTVSIALRRKLYTKSALIVQFTSLAIFAVIMFIGNCLGMA